MASCRCTAPPTSVRSGDVALFFGLSGTGKTTLSADPERTLIGDDEHGWSDRGVFNFEGGCYAKVIKLSPRPSREIYATTRRFGTVLENVVDRSRTRGGSISTTRRFTENTRAAYPISFIANAAPAGQGGHPKNVIMLTADAFGVLPPIARLTPSTGDVSLSLRLHREGGRAPRRASTEPEATFSTCFGAPFLPLPPIRLRGVARRTDRQAQESRSGWSTPAGAGDRTASGNE